MQATRARILQILREKGEATAVELAARLGLRAVTVRHHLRVLRESGLIRESRVHRSGRGRPRIVFALTEAADRLFPRNYEGLVRHLLPAAGSPEALREVARRMSQAARLEGLEGKARLAAVVTFLNEKGYLARLEQPAEGAAILDIRNCPYLEVARDQTALCTMDLALIEELVGGPVEPLACILHGDPACRYRLPPTAA